MKFGNLTFLWLLLIVPLVAVFYVWAFHHKERLLDRFVSPDLRDRLLTGFSFSRQRLKAAFVVLAIFFSVLALIRPKYGFHWEEVQRRGVDILIALDVSQSMMAQDVSPNRLERAKQKIIDLLNTVEGDRMGLIAFAGVSFLQCPLTLDYGALRIFLDELSPDLIPVPGTAIADAISKAVKAFPEGDRKSRVIILITDGEDTSGDPEAAAKAAAAEGVKIYTIGIGKEGGAPIPDPSGGFKKDQNGNMVMTTLDESMLQKVALASGGSYVRSVTGNLDLERIYQDIRASVEDKELTSGRRQRFEERFQWPLVLAFMFLLSEVFIRERPKRQTKSRWDRFLPKRFRTLPLIFLLSLGAIGAPKLAEARVVGTKARAAAEAYNGQRYSEALQFLLDAQIDDPSNEELKYNLANAYYKMGDYPNAEKLFSALTHAAAKDISVQSTYNLGNTAYQQGKLEEALKHYQKTLDLSPGDEDAKANIEFVREEIKRRLEEQKKRQEQQQNKGDNKEQDPGKKQEQDPSKNQEQDPNKKQEKDPSKKQEQEQEQEQEQDKNQQGEDSGQGESPSPQPSPEASPAGDQASESANPSPSPSPSANAEAQAKGAAEASKESAQQGTMTPEEAKRWLSTLKEDRSEYLKRKLGGQRRYRVEKDW